MPLGYLSSRARTSGNLHHLWLNNGTWWTHYTLHFGHRKRRIRRSLKTRSLDVAIRRRDELFARIAREGEWVEERSDAHFQMRDLAPTPGWGSQRQCLGIGWEVSS
jgi:hypothetical protein